MPTYVIPEELSKKQIKFIKKLNCLTMETAIYYDIVKYLSVIKVHVGSETRMIYLKTDTLVSRIGYKSPFDASSKVHDRLNNQYDFLYNRYQCFAPFYVLHHCLLEGYCIYGKFLPIEKIFPGMNLGTKQLIDIINDSLLEVRK